MKNQAGLPVMVWIHGGDFIAGSASKPLYDGRFISNHSNTVVVNIEYRLGKPHSIITIQIHLLNYFYHTDYLWGCTFTEYN